MQASSVVWLLATLLGSTIGQGWSSTTTRATTTTTPKAPGVKYEADGRLREVLFGSQANYNRETVPSTFDTPVQVDFSLMILKTEIDQESSSLRTDMFGVHMFVDPRLTWSPEDFSGIESIAVDSETIWLPDITLYQQTRVSGGSGMINPANSMGETQAIIFSNGTVIYVPSYTTITPCQLDFSNWPMDMQSCKFTFGSWVYDDSDVAFKSVSVVPPLTYDVVTPSLTWKFMGTVASKETYHFPGLPNGYDAGKITVTLMRQPDKYCSSFFGPLIASVIISVLAFLEPVGRPIKHMMFIFNIFFLIAVVLFNSATETILGKPRVFCFAYGLILLQLALISIDHMLRLTPFFGKSVMAAIAGRREGRYQKQSESEPLADPTEEKKTQRLACNFFVRTLVFGLHLFALVALYIMYWPNKLQ